MSIQNEGMYPHVGDHVHYILDAGPHQGTRRPAVIVRAWDAELVNLLVFVDGSNDYYPHQGPEPLVLWRTSVHYNNSDKPGTWTWDVRRLPRET
jgi:hypothetical protein